MLDNFDNSSSKEGEEHVISAQHFKRGITTPDLRALRLAALAPSLRELDVSHNALVSLDGVEGLPHLKRLNASANALTNLSALSALTGLTELCLHRNQIAAAGELARLSSLVNLSRLSLFGNPATAAQADGGRGATLALLGELSPLSFLDFRLVTADERAAAVRGSSPSWLELERGAKLSADTQQSRATSAGAPGFADALALLPQLPAAKQRASLRSASTAGAAADPDTAAAAAAAAALRKQPATVRVSLRHANGMPSVTLRHNGTGSLSWPSGALAAAAELDPGGGWRLVAFHNEEHGGGVALSADAEGGFAHDAAGRLVLSWKRSGEGSYRGPNGQLLGSWSSKKGSGSPFRGPITVDLGGSGMSVVLASAAGGGCAAELRAELDGSGGFSALVLSQQHGAALVPAEGFGVQTAASLEQTPPSGGGDGSSSSSMVDADGGDLAAVLKRAKALMARTDEEEEADAAAAAVPDGSEEAVVGTTE
jgi:hypothetical protein